jgi:hypothetical protein
MTRYRASSNTLEQSENFGHLELLIGRDPERDDGEDIVARSSQRRSRPRLGLAT